jgi:transposase
MKKISEETKRRIVKLKSKKVPVSEISKRLEISKPTIIKYTKLNGVSGQKNRAGRPKCLSSEAEDFLCKAFLKGKVKSLDEGRELIKKKLGLEVTKQTIKRCFDRKKIKCHVKVKKPLLTKIHKELRVNFANTFLDFDFMDWMNVIWSDESKFALINTNGIEYCWKRTSDPLKEEHIKKTLKYGGGSIIAWGCFTSKGVGKLIRVDGIMTAERYNASKNWYKCLFFQ